MAEKINYGVVMIGTSQWQFHDSIVLLEEVLGKWQIYGVGLAACCGDELLSEVVFHWDVISSVFIFDV